jgi:RHH-type rel operon transcriptional repressor/antitoxin RelB
MRYLYLTPLKGAHHVNLSTITRRPVCQTTNPRRKHGAQQTFYMIEEIKEHIGDLEDLYLAKKHLVDFCSGKTKSVPLEEVMKRYGLEA